MKTVEVSMTNLPYIPAGTEICLEEVKKEKEVTVTAGCSHDREKTCDLCDNQPLTPKDVGLTMGQAVSDFFVFIHKINDTVSVYGLSDEEFDRLFQQFLNEYKK